MEALGTFAIPYEPETVSSDEKPQLAYRVFRITRDKQGERLTHVKILSGTLHVRDDIGGEKVSPATIEQAIRSLGITDCACVAIPDPKGVLGEVPKAYLQRGDNQPAIERVKQGLIGILPPHEIPVEWEWIDKIPRTASGKIQRLKLQQ